MAAARARTLILGTVLSFAPLALVPMTSEGEAPSPSRPNLVLITLDTTRADHLGVWGWSHARTPFLDRLAARGTRFTRCDTAVPITLPSHATLLTGLFPPRHGVRDNGTFVLSEALETVSTRLRAAGYDTGAVVSAVVLSRRYGLARGFRIYDDDLGVGEDGLAEASERLAGDATRAARAVLSQLTTPYFLWVHYFDPHTDYTPPPPFDRALGGPHRAYDGEIAYMDEQIGVLLTALPEDTTWLVVGDHGEMLGDGGELEHGLLLGAGARRVPLLLVGPQLPSGRRVDCLVRTADVAPTLLELAGLEAAGDLDGRSLLPLLQPDAACDRLSYTESYLPFFAYRWYPLRALSDDRWLYVHAPRPSLYDLTADAGEVRDLAAARPRDVAAWRRRLAAMLTAAGESLEGGTVAAGKSLSAEEEAQLRSLGYFGGSSAPRQVHSDLPDPRAMIDVAKAVHRAAGLVDAGRCGEALPALQAAIHRAPHNVPALNLAGLCLRQAGRLESAFNAFQRAAEAAPNSPVPWVNGGACLLQLGRHEEAEKYYARAFALDPTAAGAAANLAALLRGRRQPVEAARVLDVAYAAGSRHLGIFLERGMLAAELQDYEAAFGHFTAALARDADHPGALESAARAALLSGKPRAAAGFFERLLALMPARADLWATLGGLYLERLDDRAAALRCFRHAHETETDAGRRNRLEALIQDLQ